LDFGQTFDNISKKMQTDFDEIRNAMEHPGEKGSSFEEIVRRFLKMYSPKSLDISTGFIIDSNDNVSKQMDVIISDATKTPIFFQNTSVRVLPVECVYAVIEVKSMLNSDELQKVFDNMKSARRLEKKAYSRIPPYDDFSVKLYDKSWPIWPINYFLFAIDSIDLNNIASAMQKKYVEENLPVHSRIDCTCVLNKGVICNRYPDGQITARALLLFYALMSSNLFQAQMPFFQIYNYLSKVHF
jgi:hypothetical protein